MTAFFIYLLQAIACSALFAGCYWWVLRNGRFYQWNRFYIVAAVVLSATIPLINIPILSPHAVMPATTDYAAHIVIDPDEVAVVPVQSKVSLIPWAWLGFVSCTFIIFILLVKEVISFARILRLKRCSDRIHTSEADLYCTDDDTAPFTFFRAIFWKKGVPMDSGEGRCMLRHELAHVRLGHSWDKALMQLVCCLFWMNPFFMLLRRELELVHEFAADNESVGDGNAGELSSLILCTLYPNHYHDFTSRFFQSSIKRRIMMMTKNKKSPMGLLRKLSIVPVILIALYAFSAKPEAPSPGQAGKSELSPASAGLTAQDPWTPQNDLERLIIVVGYQDTKAVKADVAVARDSERKIAAGAVAYNTVSQKPFFQGSADKFREYLAKNLIYPADAQAKGITGAVVVSYVVDKDGKVTDVKSPVRVNPLSDEVERVVKSSPAWTPGSQNGKAVAVQCFAFVEFKLNTTEPSRPAAAKTPASKGNSFKKGNDDVYTIVEDMPLFNGAVAEVAEKGFRDYVHKTAVYPAKAQEKGISGRVFVEFIIDTDGSLIDAKVTKGVEPLLDAEALRVISSSPKWTPGKQDGKTVKVRYTFPVEFKINESEKSAAKTASAKEGSDGLIFTIVEDMPLFNGKLAEEGFKEYVDKNLTYPETAKKEGISGRVFVEFVINQEGNLIDARITRSVNPLLDAEALRVINSSPKWTPGKQRGKAVSVKYTFPVVFELNK